MTEKELAASFYAVPDGNGLMLAARCHPDWHLPIAGNAAAVDAGCRRHMIEQHDYPADGPELYLFRPHPTVAPTIEQIDEEIS